MIVSMTGFAARRATGAGHSWAWDIRSVNGKGLDVRMRVPDWIDGLEHALRAALLHSLRRGNVSLTLKVNREGPSDAEAFRLSGTALSAALAALAQIETAASTAGLTLAQATSAHVLGIRGVIDTATLDEDPGPLRDAIVADLPALLVDFAAMRSAEGAALATVIGAQLDEAERLVVQAAAEVAARGETQTSALKDAVARLLDVTDGVDEVRLAQELALLAVKADIQEELDRLTAHVAAARSLLTDPAPVGRKFDFLIQEFMREANTLCSKAQTLALTRIGLDLKTIIDQMREQVQNVE